MAKASNVELRDFGTTFKAYRAEILKDVNLYGELHRFIPALAAFYGARVAEVPIRNHAPRRGRIALRPGPHLPRDVRHFHDLVPAEVLHPPHALLRKVGPGLRRHRRVDPHVRRRRRKSGPASDIIQDHGPLMLLGALALVTGVILFCTGLLGEVLTRTYFESQGRRIYAVREIRTRARAADRGRSPAAVEGQHSAVIFDFGGVLCFHPDRGPDRRAPRHTCGVEPREFVRALWKNRIAYDAGQDPQRILARRRATRRRAASTIALIARMIECEIDFWGRFDDRVLRLDRSASRRGLAHRRFFPTCPARSARICARRDGFLEHFDHVTFSYELNAREAAARNL